MLLVNCGYSVRHSQSSRRFQTPHSMSSPLIKTRTSPSSSSILRRHPEGNRLWEKAPALGLGQLDIQRGPAMGLVTLVEQKAPALGLGQLGRVAFGSSKSTRGKKTMVRTSKVFPSLPQSNFDSY